MSRNFWFHWENMAIFVNWLAVVVFVGGGLPALFNNHGIVDNEFVFTLLCTILPVLNLIYLYKCRPPSTEQADRTDGGISSITQSFPVL